MKLNSEPYQKNLEHETEILHNTFHNSVEF